MTINRANQTWPEDVTEDVINTLETIDAATNGLSDGLAVEINKSVNKVLTRIRETESEMEFERRQRGSASTLTALFIITLFVVCAVAVWPVLSALANLAK